KYSLLTSFFLEYKFIDVAYDQSTQIDNNSHFIYGGIKWDTTEKLAMLFKVGYQNKKFDDNSLGQEDFDGIAFDLQFTYRYSEKTTMSLDMYRTNEETDNFQASDKTVVGSVFGYKQKFTERLSGSFDFTYENSDYSNLHTVTAEDRDDWTIVLRPAGQYLFRDWLMFELAYQYERRESTDDFFDYDSNSVIFSINLAL
ncbi:outer membrane beta-barrel protein, partial [Desulfomarina sp.]